MDARRLLSGAATAALVIAVAALLLGQLLGQPILFGYVTTGSMEPAVSAGDGFVAVPSFAAGEPGPGDVVVYEAETIQGGGLTTHRIVEETDEGYVTKGDANPFTDQDGGEPHVRDGDVVAHALQIQGHVVVVPFLGTVVETVQGVLAIPFSAVGSGQIGTVMVTLGILLFVLAGLTGGDRRSTSRSRSRENVVAVWLVVLLAAGFVTMAATAAMVLPAGEYQIEMVVSEDPDDDPQVVAPGDTAEVEYDVHNGGIVPVLVASDPVSDGVRVDPDRTALEYEERSTIAVRMDAPSTTGEYSRTVRESRYLLLLPRPILEWLHSLHPLLAILAVDVVVALFVVSIVIAVFGTGYLRLRPGSDVPLRVRVERQLRRFR